QGQGTRDSLYAILQKPGGVRQLLNQPAQWEVYLKTARADLQRARAIVDGMEGSLGGDWFVRIQRLESGIADDEADYHLAIRLERIRLDRSISVRGEFDEPTAMREYPRAFATAGLAVVVHCS